MRDYFLQGLLISLVLIIYCALGVYIRRNKPDPTLLGSVQVQKIRVEIRLALIALLFTMPITLSAITYNLANFWPPLTYLGRLFGIATYIINPFVYIAFSSDIRMATLRFYFAIPTDDQRNPQNRGRRAHAVAF